MSALLEIASAAAGVLAIAGVVLNNHRRRACFVVWIASNTGSGALHLAPGMFAMGARDAVFCALAVHGLVLWGRPAKGHTEGPQRERT